ncbi:penicillin-binding transpeptidase domain-containing protein [Pseudonocardia benzenivorans]
MGRALVARGRAPEARGRAAARARRRHPRTGARRRPRRDAAAHAHAGGQRAARPDRRGRPRGRDRGARGRAGPARPGHHPAVDRRGCCRGARGPGLLRRRAAPDRLPDRQERDPRPARRPVRDPDPAARPVRGVRQPGPRPGPDGGDAPGQRRCRVVGAGRRRQRRDDRDAAGPARDVRLDGHALLDHAVQAAAEDAVETLPQQAALVAIAPSTGDVLAVAQNAPADAAGAIALTGRYPPGSTFKIVTATAALETLGVTATTPQPCPGTTTIDGRLVPNENRFDLGTVPLTKAFANSCNTTFSQLAAQLSADALPAAGLQLGFGADFTVPGLTTVTGAVPPAAERVQRAEDGFGQGDVVATPFGMALVAATVAKGAPVVPQLIRGRPTDVPKAATAPPPQPVLDQLRTMMRAVVTEGTATGLARSGAVFGKTGTAEYSANGANRAHGWFGGYRGDVAFAVLVVDGGSSGPAVGVAQRFLAALG